MIGLDSFKGYNDEHGHPAGDRLLAELTDAWQCELRLSDLIARYGGDEFALILPRTTEAEARELVSRLRAAHPASWSVGFGLWPDGEDLYDALARADRALFTAKRSRTSIPQQPDATVPSDDDARTA
jgi:diguanylate cyclase (GGDEF)-like protein